MVNTLDAGMSERVNDMKMLAAAGAILKESEQARDLLNALKKTDSVYSWLGIVKENGSILYANQKIHEGDVLPSAGELKTLDEAAEIENFDASQWLISAEKNSSDKKSTRYVRISVPIEENGVYKNKYAVAYLSWDWAKERVNSVLTPARRAAGIEIFIIDKTEKLLYASNDKQVVFPPLHTLNDPISLHWPDGKEYLTAMRYSKGINDFAGMGWRIVVRQPVDQAFSTIYLLQKYILKIGLFFVIVFVGIGFYVAWTLSRPLVQLAKDAESFRESKDVGIFQTKSALYELTLLQNSLNMLLKSRRSYEDQLSTLNANLEKKVKDRTKALEDSNKELQSSLDERQLLMKQLESLATTDSLTGLLNRRAFHERAEYEISRSQRNNQPVSLLTFDIDYFKRINDTYGHDGGDEVLQKCALVCQQQLRDIDLLARFGGEEFVILLPNTDEEHGYQVAERIRKAFEDGVIQTTKGEIRFTASFGVSAGDGSQSLKTMLHDVDQALYVAKDSGRNRVVRA
jgi:diguanylate cyclase